MSSEAPQLGGPPGGRSDRQPAQRRVRCTAASLGDGLRSDDLVRIIAVRPRILVLDQPSARGSKTFTGIRPPPASGRTPRTDRAGPIQGS